MFQIKQKYNHWLMKNGFFLFYFVLKTFTHFYKFYKSFIAIVLNEFKFIKRNIDNIYLKKKLKSIKIKNG